TFLNKLPIDVVREQLIIYFSQEPLCEAFGDSKTYKRRSENCIDVVPVASPRRCSDSPQHFRSQCRNCLPEHVCRDVMRFVNQDQAKMRQRIGSGPSGLDGREGYAVPEARSSPSASLWVGTHLGN